MKIVEKRPNGRGSVKEVVNWIQAIDKNMSDPRPFFNTLVPDIKQALKFTFSDSNPGGWPMTSQKHRDWKAKHGFPTTVGVMTEGLKRAFSENPETNTTKRRLFYTFDHSETGYKGKPVTEYVIYFNRFRKIMKYTRGFIEKHIKQAALTRWLALNKRVEK